MAFQKFATLGISKIASATWNDNKLAFEKTASPSMYANNTNSLNVRELLGKVAKEYNISDNPSDYVYEAVRAVTAEVPNQNADEFGREELLRFDHRLGQKVFQTFILKPHQINHRADNPKTARGVVIDAYYNDTGKPLDNCPACNNHTASAEGRDSVGLNCAKCGSVVKDEFVELLLAVDSKKDPTFADGVRSGALDSLSMGCLAAHTDCSICNNRAYSVSDFCTHIRGGNKKKMFKNAAGHEKMAYERCGGVTFTEISRVDQPADPTAKQRELFSIDSIPMEMESQLFMMSAKITKLESQLMSKAAQVADPVPAVPFKTVAESVKWAEKSISKLRGEITRLASEKDAKVKAASDEGRPFYAWENAGYNAQIKANLQYISRLETYVAKAADLINSGKPWGKDLTRSMSRFFANRSAQNMSPDLQETLDELGRLHPEIYNDVMQDLNPNQSPNQDPNMVQPPAQPMSIGEYAQKQEDSMDQNMTTEEMGILPDPGTQITPKESALSTIEKDLQANMTAMLDAFEESNTVTTANSDLKFASAYKSLEASVTAAGNVKVFNKSGTLFVVKPATKLANDEAATKFAKEVLTAIAEDGVVGAVAKFKPVLGPKFAQVLQFHMEDFVDGREEGDKKPSDEDGMNDMGEDRSKQEDSVVNEESTDRKDEEREKRDQSNSDVLEEHQPDHKEKLPKDLTPATEEEHSDRAEGREKKPKTTLDDVHVDHKEMKPKGKSAAKGELPDFLKKKNEEKSGEGYKDKKEEPKVEDKKAEIACMAGPECKDDKCATHAKKALDMPVAAPGTMPAMAMTAAQKKYVSRVERLYKNRMTNVTSDHAKKLAEVTKVAEKTIADRFARALKLAARRQALNLEVSPIKSAMFDVLTTEVDIDSDTFYPGMDQVTASTLIEASVSGFDPFIESIVKRASEFVAMSDEAFVALESDVKNIQAAPVVVQASARTASVKDQVRQAAVDGSMPFAPASTNDIISSNNPRDNIKAALGSTRVGQNLINKK